MKYLLTLTLILSLFTYSNTTNAQTCNGGNVAAVRDTICQGTRGNLQLVGYTGHIQWQSADGTFQFADITGATDSVYRTEPLSQTTFFRAVVTNDSCTSVSDSIKLVVPPVITASYTFTVSGQNVAFTSTSSPTGTISSYHWDFGDTQSGFEENLTHHFSLPDTSYYVCLTVYDGSNCSYTFCRSIHVDSGGANHNPVEPCSVYYIILQDVQPHVWDLFYTSTGSAPITYDWSWGDGATSIGDSVGHTYNGPGNYNICLTMHDDTGCTATYCDSSIYLYRMENNNTPIGVKPHYSSTLKTGVPFIAPGHNNLSVYPNPCTICEVRGVDEIKNLLITDVLGRQVNASLTKTTTGYQIDLPQQLTGVFIIKNIKTGEVRKFVKD